ncbi:MAG: adenylate kinase [Bacteroidaceae bacterium]|nr:adenylate kinase [Bacteroidaceae bacterium]
MLNIVIFGAPGSGKGTYSARLVDTFKLDHISTGDVLRAEIKNGTELGKIAQGYIDNGQLIPDELMIGILASAYDSFKGSKGVIFDGFPRTIAQAEALKKMLEERGEKISAMINLEVSEDILMARLLRRATLEGRADDNEETIKKRFAVYHNQTAPLIEWFKGQGVFNGFTYTDEIGLEGMVKNITEYVNTIV